MEVRSVAIPPITEKDSDRFWSKVAFTANPNKCWNWTLFKHRGYGRFYLKVEGRKKTVNFIAPRISYYLHNNVDPVGKAVLHTCDNPSCVNPKHLFLGTNKENTHDMMKKNRGVQPKGSRHGRSKLNEQIVLEIRDKYLAGVTQKELAKQHNVDVSAISLIVTKKTWSHI